MSVLGGKKAKPVLAYLVLSLLPVIATVIFYYRSIYNGMENELLSADGQKISRVAESIDRDVVATLDIMNRLYMNESLNELIDRKYDDYSSFIKAYQDEILTNMSMLIPINSPVERCVIFTDNPTVFNSALVQRLDTSAADWYEPSRGYDNPVSRHSYGKYGISVKEGVLFSMIRGMNMYRNHSRYTKLLKIDLVPDFFLSDLDIFDGAFYVVDSAGMVVASDDKSLYGNPPPFDTEVPDKYRLQVPIRSLPGWYVAGIVDVENIRSSIMRQQITAIVFLFLITAVMAFVIFKLVGDIYKARLRETEILLEKRQAQLSALHRQLNPHLFFNALETVRMKLLLSGEREHSTIIMRMARLLRKLMLWKDDIVTLREEISFIKEFMSIQEYCCGERMTWSIEADDGAMSCEIPKMLLQTFIENACVHGIRDAGEKTEIRVFARESDGLLYLSVADNGKGMKPEVKERLNLLFSDEYKDESGIGIPNAVNRLRLYYGGAFSVRLESEETEGTRVEITLPVRRGTG